MTIRRATTVDIGLVELGLSRLPNPPNMGEGDIERSIEFHDFFYVDTVREVFVLVIPRQEELDTYIPYWIWEGKTNARLQTPVLGVACRAVRRAHPDLGPRRIWGDFPGAGDTVTERKADSTRQAREHDSWLGSDLSDKDAENPKMRQGQSTLDAVIAAIDALEAV